MSTLAEFHESDLTEGESETGGDQYQESCAIHFISNSITKDLRKRSNSAKFVC